jgi:hypothetical protein
LFKSPVPKPLSREINSRYATQLVGASEIWSKKYLAEKIFGRKIFGRTDLVERIWVFGRTKTNLANVSTVVVQHF